MVQLHTDESVAGIKDRAIIILGEAEKRLGFMFEVIKGRVSLDNFI